MWIVPQSILSDFVRASECSISELQPHLNNSDSSLTLRPCVNGKPTPRPFSWKGWQNRPWSRALFGAAISATSMEIRFAEWWTSLLRDSPANHTASPENNSDCPTGEVTAKTAKGRSRNSCESFKSVDPPWFSAKTFLPGFFEDTSDLSERNYREWVTQSKARSLSLRNRLGRVTKGSECSSWLTPNAALLNSLTCSGDGREKPNKLAWQVAMWPTPAANDDNKSPEAHLAMKQRMGERDGTRSNRTAITSLNVMTKAWSTPKATERSSQSTESTAKGFSPTLLDQSSNWPTPAARDYRNDAGTESQSNRNTPNLSHACLACSLPAQTPTGEKSPNGNGLQRQQMDLIATLFKTPSGEFSEVLARAETVANEKEWQDKLRTLFPPKRRLNPSFVCWLMGLPSWWTHPETISFAAVEMDAYHSKLRSLLSSYSSVL